MSGESWLAYTDPEASPEENTLRPVSALRAGQAYNAVCLMLGGRWPDAKLEQEAPDAHRFFMELIGAKPSADDISDKDLSVMELTRETLAERIVTAEAKHGGLRAAAKALGIDPGYLHRLKSAKKTNPGDDVLQALGLERVTFYRISQENPNDH